MKHFLRKIDATGLFLADEFWDDGAYDATPGVPLMTEGSPAVTAIPAVTAQDATEGEQMYVGGLPATDANDAPVWITPPAPEVLAVAEVPAIPEVLPVQQTDAQGSLLWITAPIPAFAGHPIPPDLIATACPEGFYWPKWDGSQWIEGGSAPVPTVAQIQAAIVSATQARLDTFAQTRNYDSILSACTYATSSVSQFATEGQAAVNARDATWATLYTHMGAVLAGTAPMPTGYADLEPMLPALEWPL